jgi:hypothetical protein
MVLNVILSEHFSSPVRFTSVTHFNLRDLIPIDVSGEDKRNTSPYAILPIFLS